MLISKWPNMIAVNLPMIIWDFWFNNACSYIDLLMVFIFYIIFTFFDIALRCALRCWEPEEASLKPLSSELEGSLQSCPVL